MPNLIIGLFLLYLLLLAIKQFGRMSPAAAARLVRHGGGVAGLVGALLLFLRGRIGLASTLAGAAATFAGWGKFGGVGGAFRPAGAGGRRTSHISSAMLEMSLDLDSGAMSGTILAGPFENRALDSLARPDLMSFYATLQRDDPDGATLLEQYLDRRFAGWREADEGQGEGRRSGGGASAGGSGAMTAREAYEVLGLPQGASAEDIIRAHRSLMKKFHPDHGGSTALAARVNQAKDVLLHRHG